MLADGPVYYNEFDPYAAQWLRNLIMAGHISDGIVDERSIVEVKATDLVGFRRCHFFAGIAGWELALRYAEWPADREVWTGSCPCQPFSHAGQRRGFDDERHLWPVWFRLIEQRRPAIVFGEQVAAAIRQRWLDLVFDDLEGSGYACRAEDLPAASVGAPHIRQRLWWVAHADQQRRTRVDALLRQDATGRLAGDLLEVAGRGETCGGMADAEGIGLGQGRAHDARRAKGTGTQGTGRGPADVGGGGEPWRELEWLACRDGKRRPTQPGLFPLAHGVPARVGRLRAYGNAIVPQVAAEFIKDVIRCRP